MFCNLSPTRMFMPLDLLPEYRIQHGAIESLFVTSSYSTRIFYRGVSDFATEWRLVSRINHLPPACWCKFWKSTVKQELGCRFEIMDSISDFLSILTYATIYVLIHHIIFGSIFTSEILFFIFSSTHVLTFTIAVVFIHSYGPAHERRAVDLWHHIQEQKTPQRHEHPVEQVTSLIQKEGPCLVLSS